MPDEKQNNAAHWKNKLDELNRLPGEVITDKNAAWEKLHNRLREKPRRNKMIWYWAAACLLLAILIPWIITTKKENILAKNTRQYKRNKTIPAFRSPIYQKEIVAAAPAIRVEKKQMINSSKKNKTSITVNNTVKINEPVIAVISTPIEIKPEIINKAIPLSDTAAAIITATTVKKKMRVVNINELENPTEQLASFSNHEQNNRRIKLGNSKTINSSPAAQQEYAGILKIKIPLKN